jgi:hypothetical protein
MTGLSTTSMDMGSAKLDCSTRVPVTTIGLSAGATGAAAEVPRGCEDCSCAEAKPDASNSVVMLVVMLAHSP